MITHRYYIKVIAEIENLNYIVYLDIVRHLQKILTPKSFGAIYTSPLDREPYFSPEHTVIDIFEINLIL